MGTEQAKRLRELERENAQLRRVVDLTLDKVILKEAKVFIELWRKEYNAHRPLSA